MSWPAAFAIVGSLVSFFAVMGWIAYLAHKDNDKGSVDQ